MAGSRHIKQRSLIATILAPFSAFGGIPPILKFNSIFMRSRTRFQSRIFDVCNYFAGIGRFSGFKRGWRSEFW